MKQPFTALFRPLLLALTLGTGYTARGQTYSQVPLTAASFTADVVANGAAALPPTSSATADVDGTGYYFMSKDYYTATTAHTSGIPDNGLIPNSITGYSALTYQLASLSANNSLRIAGGAVGTGTITFATPTAASEVYVLASSGSAASTIDMTVNFSDGTTTTFAAQTVPDWFTVSATQNVYSMQARSSPTTPIGPVNTSGAPFLDQVKLTIPAAKTTTTITGITFAKTSTASYLQVMAVSIATYPACTAPPTAGTTTASATSLCAGSTVTLSLTGANTGTGLTYQWQSSTTGVAGSFTNITGATSSTYTTPVLTQTMYYQAVLTCSGQSATSTPVTVTVLAPVYATLPYTQGFESTWLSRCNTDDAPDASWLNTPATGNNSWRRDDDGATAGWTSPTAGAFTPAGSNANGATSSHSARFHSYYTSNGVMGTLDLYADLSAAGSKRLTFDYINKSTGGSKLDVLLSTDGGVTFSTTPLLTITTATAFATQTVDLTTTSATTVVRFRATSDFGSYDIGVDNVLLRTLPPVDIAPTALATPTSTQGCYGSAETVSVVVTNMGGGTINFVTNPATVSVVVTTPGGPQTLTGSITTGTLAAGATQTVTLTPTLNMVTLGTYTFAITATVTGDGNTANDLLTPAPTRTAAAPVAGTLSPSATSVCNSGTASLTLVGSANGSIQYQSSTSATGTFTNITGATSAAYTTAVLTTTTYYRAQVTCGANVVTSNVSTITVNTPAVASTNSPVSICAGSTGTLTATPAAGSSVRFFSAATGGTALTTTTAGSYTTPALTANTTYYAESYVGSMENVGPTTQTSTGLSAQTGGALYFTATAPTTIQSVTVFLAAGQAAGTVTIALRTGSSTSGAIVNSQSTAFAVPANTTAAVISYVVPLNYSVPAAGAYTLHLVSATQGGLLRDNAGANITGYPYTSPSGVISITGVSTTGYYYYFYNWVIGGECIGAAARTAIQVNVTPPATAGFSYPTTAVCAGTAATLTPTLATGATAGTYSLPTATGLSINATTGVVTIGTTAAAGTYTVTNTLAASGNCGPQTSTATFTIGSPTTATFSYPAGPYCGSGTTNPTPTITGTAGGTFSAPTGLTINATTGAVTLSSSTPGTYVVTYAVTGACGNSSSTQSLTISAPPTAGFSFPVATGCAGTAATLTPTLATGATAGTYSLPTATGLSINATTGVVTIGTTATTGTYTVTNTVAAANGCAQVTSTATFTIMAPVASTFSYSGSPFCTTGTNPTPTITGAAGGTFSSTTGLTINATTGAITLSSSTAGTYVVTYTVASSATQCGSSSTQSVTITAPQTAGFSYATPASGTACAGSNGSFAAVMATGATAGTFSVTPSGVTVNATTGALSIAGAAAGTYTVTNTVAASGGCAATTSTATFVVNPVPATPTLATSGTPATGITLTSNSTTGNQFYLNGVAVTGATGTSYYVSSGPKSGSYTVVVTGTGGCASAASAAVNVTVTATAPAAAGTSLTLYPNPTQDGHLTLELHGYQETVTLQVVNALGQRVYAGTMSGTAQTRQQALDLSALPTGVYLLQARTASGSVETRRFVRE